MEDKIAAGGFGRATNNRWDGPYMSQDLEDFWRATFL